jgi:P-type Cu+ transporter
LDSTLHTTSINAPAGNSAGLVLEADLPSLTFSSTEELAKENRQTNDSGGRNSRRAACFHCGEPCVSSTIARSDKVFCCQGCLLVHDLLAENGMDQFYALSAHPGVRVREPQSRREQWAYLDDPSLQQRLLDFTDGKISCVTFHIPAIHCVACVWLLENLFRLHPGIGKSQVNFPRREVAIRFASESLRLSELVALLVSLGYEPRLTLNELETRQADPARRRRWLQLGLAGFAFGNIMLFSLPDYLGLDSLNGPLFKAVFGYLRLVLAVPVIAYSASDYWRSAWWSVRRRALTLDVPIAIGLAALYIQSAIEVLSGHGIGYLDSLTGLVFFLLCGRAFQQKTFDRMAFDRDYKCFFPLSARRKTPAGVENVSISSLDVGDHLLLRNGELIPADAKLISGPAVIDYSFVTGESDPAIKQPGDYLYAGGRQLGETIEVETAKPVSHSYLTSLWNHEAFQKQRESDLNTLTNRYSRRFTRIVIATAIGAALFWLISGDAVRGIKAFVSVLIVACPCALALAAPFALGTAQRLLAKLQVFLKNPLIIERMTQVNEIVFDKTGTLTVANASDVRFCPSAEGEARDVKFPSDNRGLSNREAAWVESLARHSTHPHSARISEWFAVQRPPNIEPGSASSFVEVPGAGIKCEIEGHSIKLGSRSWLEGAGIKASQTPLPPGSAVYLAIDQTMRGAFVLTNSLRPAADRLLETLGTQYGLSLLSGDHEGERERFGKLFNHAGTEQSGQNAAASPPALRFKQSPLDKLGFIQNLQKSGKVVMMVGDGLNDAGALRQSDVGAAIVEKIGTFSPASDIILSADQVPNLDRILALARRTVAVLRVSFGISALYNLVGISIAAAGILSPLVCAVLMPLSSISVVLFACGATHFQARKLELTP